MRAGWAADTCDPVDLPWSTDNPAKGQCGVTALVVNDLLGGDLMSAKVLFPDSTLQGWHTWNVFGDGFEVGLSPRAVPGGRGRPAPGADHPTPRPGRPREPERYEALRGRALAVRDA